MHFVMIPIVDVENDRNHSISAHTWSRIKGSSSCFLILMYGFCWFYRDIFHAILILLIPRDGKISSVRKALFTITNKRQKIA